MTSIPLPQHLVTRFAPSPTGLLHVGHAWSALMAMDAARTSGGSFHLRIEDIDGARSREEHVEGILRDLAWLGVEWDGPVVRQSERLEHYAAALDRLKAMGLAYPCFCTRADIAAEIAASASAPHGADGPPYPGTCRRLSDAERARRVEAEAHAWRIDMARAVDLVGPIIWYEGTGSQTPFGLSLSKPCSSLEAKAVLRQAQDERIKDIHRIIADPLRAGDVVLARKDAPTSYHLAATLDDAAMGIAFVLRGRDLIAATDVHRLLQALLDLPTPLYRHHPLLVGPDGKRLAKRTGGISLAELRESGVDPARLAADLRAGVFPVGIAIGEA